MDFPILYLLNFTYTHKYIYIFSKNTCQNKKVNSSFYKNITVKRPSLILHIRPYHIETLKKISLTLPVGPTSLEKAL